MGKTPDPVNDASAPVQSFESGASPVTQKEATAMWMQELAPFAILTTDPQLRITGWNQWLVTHSGLEVQEVLGKSLFTLFPELEKRKLHDCFGRALAGEVIVLSAALHRHLLPMSTTVRESDESHMVQTARIAPLHSGNQILGTITIIEDVSQREFHAGVLRRQHARDRLLSWALAHLLQTKDTLGEVDSLFAKVTEELALDGCFVPSEYSSRPRHSINSAMPALVGFIRGIEGDLASPLILDRIRASDKVEAAGLSLAGIEACAVFPLRISERALGVIAFASTQRETIPAGDITFLSTLSQYIAIAIDRSLREGALRQAEQELRNHADLLEVTVTERTARLHETIAQLESFSYSVAHDLRAPIRSLQGYCDVLEEDFPSSLTPEGRGIIGKLSRSARRLDELTRDLLRFSQISLQEVKLENVDLLPLIEDILALRPTLREGVLTIHHSLGQVYGQRTLIHQCISNILENAMKFRRPDVPAKISVRSERVNFERAQPKLSKAPFNPATLAPFANTRKSVAAAPAAVVEIRRRIWIEDNGIGIPPEAHQKIFGIFERITEVGSPEGTGIGLAIVARAMQRMGGTCGVESSLGVGSRFWLEFNDASSDSAKLD